MIPGFWIERIYVVFMMVISFIVCSTILSEIVVVFQKFNEDTAELRKDLHAMTEFMSHRKVPIALQGKVKRYLEFLHKAKKSGNTNAQHFLDQLSPHLRT